MPIRQIRGKPGGTNTFRGGFVKVGAVPRVGSYRHHSFTVSRRITISRTWLQVSSGWYNLEPVSRGRPIRCGNAETEVSDAVRIDDTDRRLSGVTDRLGRRSTAAPGNPDARWLGRAETDRLSGEEPDQVRACRIPGCGKQLAGADGAIGPKRASQGPEGFPARDQSGRFPGGGRSGSRCTSQCGGIFLRRLYYGAVANAFAGPASADIDGASPTGRVSHYQARERGGVQALGRRQDRENLCGSQAPAAIFNGFAARREHTAISRRIPNRSRRRWLS